MDRARRLRLGSLLTRAEAAAPVGVVDAMAAPLREMLDASEVGFLIADWRSSPHTRWRAARRGSPGTPAFLNARGKRWTRNAVAQHVLRPALEEANRQR